jgi:hypothetical protein
MLLLGGSHAPQRASHGPETRAAAQGYERGGANYQEDFDMDRIDGKTTEQSSRDPQLPEFGKAEPGSVLDQLDHLHADLEAARESRAASRRADLEARALAFLRGEPEPFPADEGAATDGLVGVEPLDPDELDLGTFSGIRAARRAGLLPDRFNQTREEFDEQVRAYQAERFAELHSGQRQPRVTRRIDFDPRSRAYTTQTRRGGSWSTPRIVTFACRRVPRTSLPSARSRASRCRRSHTAVRGSSRQRSRAPSGDNAGSEPGPDPEGSGEFFIDDEVLHAAAHVEAVFGDQVSRRQFHLAVEPLVGDLDPRLVGDAKDRIFMALPTDLRRSFWESLRAEIDRDRMRVGSETWAPRRSSDASAHEQLRRLAEKDGAA